MKNALRSSRTSESLLEEAGRRSGCQLVAAAERRRALAAAGGSGSQRRRQHQACALHLAAAQPCNP
jgi:hypothetical protein